MPASPSVRHIILFTALALGLSACGSKDNGSTNTVAMKNLEVVDGTASDAMTDLDGVKSEGTSTVVTNSSNASAPAPTETPTNSTEAADTEVIADQ
ncbi:MAG: hypothetical protein ACSLE1_01700 [Sphingobium sp.]